MDSDENDVYDDEDDAFDDSSVDGEQEGEEAVPKSPPRSESSASTVSPKEATPTVLSTTSATTRPLVSSLDDGVTARNAATDPGGAMETPPESARGAKPLGAAEGAVSPTGDGVVGRTQTESRAACEQTVDLGPVSAAGSVVVARAATPAVAPSEPVAVGAVGAGEVGTPVTAPPPSTQTGTPSLVAEDSEQGLRKQIQQSFGVPVPPPAVRSSKTTTTAGSLSSSMVGREVGREDDASTDQKGRAAQATDGTIGKGDGGDGGGGAKLPRQMQPVSARR